MTHTHVTVFLRRLVPALMVVVLLAGFAPDVWAAPGRHALQEKTYPGLDSPDPEVRAAAVQAIRAAKDKSAVRALLDHLEDPDERVG